MCPPIEILVLFQVNWMKSTEVLLEFGWNFNFHEKKDELSGRLVQGEFVMEEKSHWRYFIIQEQDDYNLGKLLGGVVDAISIFFHLKY